MLVGFAHPLAAGFPLIALAVDFGKSFPLCFLWVNFIHNPCNHPCQGTNHNHCDNQEHQPTGVSSAATPLCLCFKLVVTGQDSISSLFLWAILWAIYQLFFKNGSGWAGISQKLLWFFTLFFSLYSIPCPDSSGTSPLTHNTNYNLIKFHISSRISFKGRMVAARLAVTAWAACP